jgi:hypothetical protein
MVYTESFPTRKRKVSNHYTKWRNSMAARNDITGDLIKTRVGNTDKFKKGYDGIDWSVKMEDDLEAETLDDLGLDLTQDTE